MIYLLAAIIAVALKAHYSAATANDLRWVLTPTATLVGWLRNEPMLFEASLGWVPADHRYIIAPACAGVNFMILLVCIAVVGFSGRWRSFSQRCLWLAAVLAGAYACTIAVNALRIVVAVWLYEAEVHAGWLTAERVHRVVGTVLYLVALSAAWCGLDGLSIGACGGLAQESGSVEGRALRDHAGPRGPRPVASRRSALHDGRSTVSLPLLCYVGMTVVLPLANGACRRFGDHYIEHALTVSLLALAVGLLLSLRRSVTSSPTGSATKDGAHGQSDDIGG